jgi:hypothetical protein
MDHRVTHDLDLETAKRVTDKAFESYSERFPNYKPTLEWVREKKAAITFSAKGIVLAGSIVLSEGAIDLGLDVPFLFRPFKKKAMEIVENEIENWIQKAKDGEL